MPRSQFTRRCEFLGRNGTLTQWAVAYLLADPDVLRYTGQVLTAGQLAREYQFLDVDGRQPAAFEMPDKMALD